MDLGDLWRSTPSPSLTTTQGNLQRQAEALPLSNMYWAANHGGLPSFCRLSSWIDLGSTATMPLQCICRHSNPCTIRTRRLNWSSTSEANDGISISTPPWITCHRVHLQEWKILYSTLHWLERFWRAISLFRSKYSTNELIRTPDT